jgi:segregation and condensation protein B
VLNATAEVISEAVESAPEGDNATGGEAAGIAGGENSEASPETNTEANVEPAASDETQPVAGASVMAPEMSARKRSKPVKSEQEIAEDKAVKARLREVLAELSADYADEARGMEVRQVAGGYRLATKPEHHDVVRAFAKSLKPPIRLSLAALETLAVIAYKQPVTGPEISDIRGIESAGVLGTLLERKLITTSGRKQVIGRPMQYKTSKEFLLRFGLNEINELPSMEEFSQLVSDGIELAPAGDVEAAAEPTLFDGEGAEGQTEALENDSAENDVKQDEAKQDDAPKKEAVETTSQAEATAAGDEGQRKE